MSEEVLSELDRMEEAFESAESYLNGILDIAIRIRDIEGVSPAIADAASRAGEIANVCIRQIDRGLDLVSEAMYMERGLQRSF